MANNTLFILTEGDHDSAFLYRILKANGFTSYSVKIKDYPAPLNSFLQTDIINVSIPEVKVQQARTRFLPYYVMQKGDNLIFIYSIGGDSKNEIRTALVSALNAFNIDDEDDLAIQALPNTTMSVLYFFDADDKGTDFRVAQIIEEIKPAFPKFKFEENSNYNASAFYQIEDLKIGAYIFREVEEDKGMLEDIMLPLMQDGNEDVFLAAETFLTTNTTCTLFKDKLKYDETETVLKKVNKQKYSHRKSIIGTIGQLQKSGKSNTVCISDADYLNKDKILNNQTCKDIVELINKVMI
ncbi:hypothetical protein G1K73_12695 [Tenacibaculum finnmarkense]|uniref:DUF3226 domain-containing protein n=1 Tax=Tenacibaculum finnmarkense TaxID=2781243 RepID=UPI001EFBDDFF|nr:DUF3226 domain-containing protein [Tenacibaculum finnmarkense]MCG8894598.1 hypothetical protein [Tenacibaculum finnmarkense]